MDVARLQRMFAINVFGSFLVRARGGAPHDAPRHGGARRRDRQRVVGGAARLGGPGEYVDYAASQGRDRHLHGRPGQGGRRRGIRVNAVRPGLIDTDIHASGGQPDRAARLAPLVPMQRAGSADEVAAAIVWLLSDEARYTTGAIVDVTGGR